MTGNTETNTKFTVSFFLLYTMLLVSCMPIGSEEEEEEEEEEEDDE